LLDHAVLEPAADTLSALETWDAASIEAALRELAERLGRKPAQAFQPIRVAVTGSRVSPGLFESLELLGRDESLRRIRRAAAEAA
jgi:glutamyl-tRNA synthetase